MTSRVPMKWLRVAGTGVLAAGIAISSTTPALAAPSADPGAPGPKNIIHLIGDGMGFNQVDLGSQFEHGRTAYQTTVKPGGVSTPVPGQAGTQVYQEFPVALAMSTYQFGNTYDPAQNWSSFAAPLKNSTDSAAAATTLATGVKTLNNVIGQDENHEDLRTVAERALELGKATGVVTSVPWTHATPASYLAHNEHRNNYHDIAADMMDSGANVIFGAGNPWYDDNGDRRVTPKYDYIGETEWNKLVDGQSAFDLVESKDDFLALAEGDTPTHVLGTAQVAGTLQADRTALKSGDVPFTAPQNDDVPSLPQMTDAALNVLSNASDEGFFVMIEGGAIDWASHDNNTAGAVEEQVDFNRTIETVVDWVEENSSWDETLVVITADHECGYLSGPAANPAWTPVQGVQGGAPQVSWNSGGHTNHLVPVYAKGPGSELLAAAATGTDPVRGAYLDNADVGRVSNELWAANDADGIPLVAIVPDAGEVGGKLTLSVADAGAGVALTGGENVGDRLRFAGRLPEVSVTDSRAAATVGGGGWTVSGQSSDLTSGPRTLRAQNLGWTPGLVSAKDGVSTGSPVASLLGGGTGLAAPATLATATADGRLGTTTVSADLALEVPVDTRAGDYAGALTVSLFPVD